MYEADFVRARFPQTEHHYPEGTASGGCFLVSRTLKRRMTLRRWHIRVAQLGRVVICRKYIRTAVCCVYCVCVHRDKYTFICAVVYWDIVTHGGSVFASFYVLFGDDVGVKCECFHTKCGR